MAKAAARRASRRTLKDLAVYEPVNLAMDILANAGLEYVAGLLTPAGNTLIASSKGGRQALALRQHLREALSEHAGEEEEMP